MLRRYLMLKMNTHPVEGKLSICHNLTEAPHIRATLKIPAIGKVRDAFNVYLQDKREDARMTLEWLEEENGEFFGYTVGGIIMNRHFPALRFAVFRSVEAIQRKE